MLNLWCSVLEKFVFIFNEIMILLFKWKSEWDCFYAKLSNLMVNKEIYFILILIALSVILSHKLLRYIPEKYFQLSAVEASYFRLLFSYSILGVVIFYSFSHLIVILFAFVFLNFTFLLFIIDYKTGYLPDVLTFPFLFMGVLYQVSSPAGNVVSAIYAIAIAYISILALTVVIEKVKKQPQMGRGDFKLIAGCAAWLGVMNLPYFLGSAAGLGLLHYSVSYWVLPKFNVVSGKSYLNSGNSMNVGSPTIPFGPAILMSASIWLYLSLISL